MNKSWSDKQKMDGLFIFLILSLLLTGLALGNINLMAIFPHPSQLLTDYFEIAGIGSGFINSGLTLALVFIFFQFNLHQYSGSIIGNLFLVTGFAMFGKNLFNILPLLIGFQLYIWLNPSEKQKATTIALAATTLGPLISVLLFLIGIHWLFVFIIGILIGYFFTLLTPWFFKLHQGYTIFNAGFTAGFIAFFIYRILLVFNYSVYPMSASASYPQALYFLLILNLVFIALGLYLKGYQVSLTSSSRDFYQAYGFNYSILNMGIIGLLLTLILFVSKAPINGVTLGSVLSLIGFGAYEYQPRTILPVIVGTALGFWIQQKAFNQSSVIIAVLFSSGLSPVVSRESSLMGLVAGFMHSLLILHTGILQGFMNLYNNGFVTGLVGSTMNLFRKLRPFNHKKHKVNH